MQTYHISQWPNNVRLCDPAPPVHSLSIWSLLWLSCGWIHKSVTLVTYLCGPSYLTHKIHIQLFGSRYGPRMRASYQNEESAQGGNQGWFVNSGCACVWGGKYLKEFWITLILIEERRCFTQKIHPIFITWGCASVEAEIFTGVKSPSTSSNKILPILSVQIVTPKSFIIGNHDEACHSSNLQHGFLKNSVK